MQGLIRLVFGLAVLAGVAGCAVPHGGPASDGRLAITSDSRYPVLRHIRYGFTLRNTSADLLSKADFWAYAPVSQTSSQRILRLTASYPYRLIEDDLGNQILHFEFKDFPPYGSKVVTIQAELGMSDKANPLRLKKADRFLAPQPYIESAAEQVVALAQSLRKDSDLETAKNAYDWLVGNVTSEFYIPDDRGALYALENKTGDCTEFAYLFAALGRANKIPTRAVGGYVVNENAILKAVDYHNWAEFHQGGAWHVADAQKRAYMQNQGAYVAMRIIGPEKENPLGNSHRFHYSGAGLAVTMN
jgi:transglutaminase-like putative cysteine protease